MEYICNFDACPYEGPKPFVLAVPSEICADENNCATMYCPHCDKELSVRKTTPSSPE